MFAVTNHNGRYTLSKSDKKKIEAHARAIAKKAAYDGAIEAWLDFETGEIHYMECVGSDYCVSDSNSMEQICRVFTPAR